VSIAQLFGVFNQTSPRIYSWVIDIKKEPLTNWGPEKGKEYYFFVSGLARMQTRNVKERTNIVKIIWE